MANTKKISTSLRVSQKDFDQINDLLASEKRGSKAELLSILINEALEARAGK